MLLSLLLAFWLYFEIRKALHIRRAKFLCGRIPRTLRGHRELLMVKTLTKRSALCQKYINMITKLRKIYIKIKFHHKCTNLRSHPCHQITTQNFTNCRNFYKLRKLLLSSKVSKFFYFNCWR